jgi:hypothetical protein
LGVEHLALDVAALQSALKSLGAKIHANELNATDSIDDEV